MTKKKCQMRHFKTRWLQRTGDLLDSNMYDTMIEMIQRGKTQLYDKQSNRVSVHVVTLGSESHRVVYDRFRKQIVTVLPKEIL